MKKGFAVLAAAVLVVAACGREGSKTEDTLATAEPLSSPTASAQDGTSAASPGATSDATATTAPGATASAARGATSAPAAKPPPGGYNAPRDGSYVYSYSGERNNPFDPAGGKEQFNGTLTNKVSHSGNIYTNESTNSESPGRTTIRTRWSATKVEMLSLKTESQAGDFSCEFNPPLIIVKFPVKPETYPKQEMKGEGNACNGSLEITIERQEAAKDATGRSWSTWRAKVRIVVKSEQLTITQNETRWVTPELGVEVRSQGSSEATFGAQKFTQTSTSALKSHP